MVGPSLWAHPSRWRIEVRCRNGGAWDRSTHLGIADDYDAACALAEAEQAEWLRFREQPCTCLDVGRVAAVRQPQRPDGQMLELASFPTAEGASAYLRDHFPEAGSAGWSVSIVISWRLEARLASVVSRALAWWRSFPVRIRTPGRAPFGGRL